MYKTVHNCEQLPFSVYYDHHLDSINKCRRNLDWSLVYVDVDVKIFALTRQWFSQRLYSDYASINNAV